MNWDSIIFYVSMAWFGLPGLPFLLDAWDAIQRARLDSPRKR